MLYGHSATSIDPAIRRVRLANGATLPFTKLVLATGSRPIRLNVPGMDLPGVMTFRDLGDVATIEAAAASKPKAVVIGGGLLGLEAAYGLAKAGAQVSVVHLMDRLMERQLDPRASVLLQRAVEARGITVHLGAETARIRGDKRAEAVVLKSGSEIAADLVVVAAGIRPNIDLARNANLDVDRGIVVDDRMQSSTAGIYAIGECAEHRGICYGLVEPAYEQARVLAGNLAGGNGAYGGSVLATNLKVSGVSVFSAGDFMGAPGTEQIVLSDPGLGSYKRLVIADGRLIGAVLFGDTADGLWYLELIRAGASIESFRDDLMFGRAMAERAMPARPMPVPQGGVRPIMSSDFTPDQKRYLEGFSSGLAAARAARGQLPARTAQSEPAGPDAIHIKAQDRVLAAGGKLADQEKIKREQHPFDAYGRLKEQAAKNEAPKAADNFRWRYYGLFYVAPAQTSYMCRLRIPNGILRHWQLNGLADLAVDYAGGYSHVTTRANLQMREIEPKNAVAMVEALLDLGLGSRGTGADNIRNVTGTPTAGIDPQELLDTRPFAREWHNHILNERALYGLPRKFNVGFDGAGRIPVLEDTNDIGFQAVEVKDGFGVEPGIWFRLALGGITGHRDFAKDTGVIVKPEEATLVADAIVRVYIEHGDRTDRNKARLKYVLDAWGLPKFIAHVEEKLGRKLVKVAAEAIPPRPVFDRSAHVGVHRQKQPGLNWIGVVLPVARLTAEQMRGLAKIAQDLGDGDIRLTVWQNLLISGVADDKVALAEAAIDALGLTTEATSIRAGLVACTGNGRLPLLGVQYQAACRTDRAILRGACRSRRAGQHPSHRLPSFLRAALHRRYRADRLQGRCRRGRRSGRGLPHPCRRRLRAGRRPRSGNLSRREGRACAAHGRAHAQGLSRQPRLARRNVPGVLAPA